MNSRTATTYATTSSAAHQASATQTSFPTGCSASSARRVSTIDVTYPGTPVWIYADPQYLRLILEPILAFAETGGWSEAFAPHDVGAHYPNASGSNPGTGATDPS